MENISNYSQEVWEEFCELVRKFKSEDMETFIWIMKEELTVKYDDDVLTHLWYAIREEEQK